MKDNFVTIDTSTYESLQQELAKLRQQVIEHGFYRDKAETALKQCKSQIRWFMEHVPAAVAMFDRHMRCLLVSRRWQEDFGLVEQNIIGRSYYEIFPQIPDRWKSVHQRCLAGAVEKCDQDAFLRTNGTKDWIAWEVRPWYDERGDIGGIIMFSELITQQKQAEASLVQMNEELEARLGQLVAGIAHEINNPVNFIHGNLVHATEYTNDLLKVIQAYQKYYPDPCLELEELIELVELDFLVADFSKLLGSMQIGTQRIQEIIAALCNFSRLDEAETNEVDIHAGIDSTLIILQSRLKVIANRLPIELIKDYDNLPLVECYAAPLNQVFMNILVNAIDALEEGDRDRTLAEMKQYPSWIRIATEIVEASSQVRITITDNGPGIDAATKSRIFEPFFTTKPMGKRTGLGMSISYQIITEKHKGSLECISAVGEGTTFVISIPIRQGTRSISS